MESDTKTSALLMTSICLMWETKPDLIRADCFCLFAEGLVPADNSWVDKFVIYWGRSAVYFPPPTERCGDCALRKHRARDVSSPHFCSPSRINSIKLSAAVGVAIHNYRITGRHAVLASDSAAECNQIGLPGIATQCPHTPIDNYTVNRNNSGHRKQWIL